MTLGPTQTLALRALAQSPLPGRMVCRATGTPGTIEAFHQLEDSGLAEHLRCGCWSLTDEGRGALEEEEEEKTPPTAG